MKGFETETGPRDMFWPLNHSKPMGFNQISLNVIHFRWISSCAQGPNMTMPSKPEARWTVARLHLGHLGIKIDRFKADNAQPLP